MKWKQTRSAGSHPSIKAKVLDFSYQVSEFETYSRYNFHFRTNTLGKGMKPLIHLAIL